MIVAAELATFAVLGIIFVILVWNKRIFTSFWKMINPFLRYGSRSKNEGGRVDDGCHRQGHTRRLRRPAVDIYRQLRRYCNYHIDVESARSETSSEDLSVKRDKAYLDVCAAPRSNEEHLSLYGFDLV